jgi:hypothetical protein
MLKKTILALAIAASVGTAMAQVVIVREAPPPPRAETMPGQRAGHEWAPGHWDWRRGQYVWVQGHWIRQRRGEHWVPERWVERNGHWELVAGHWQRGPRPMGDRDHDGVPNRFDQAPNNPNRR